MSIFQFIPSYIVIGILCGISFELLMTELSMSDSTTNFERFTWIIFWPVYVLLFVIGIKK